MTPAQILHRAVIVASVFLAASTVPGSVPQTINYQGRLLANTPTQPPIDGSFTIVFSLWTSVTGGTQLWTETWNGVAVNKGIFSVILGTNGTPIPPATFTGTSVFLQLVVAGETLAPRQQLGSVGWAMEAQNAATATAAATASDLACTSCVSGVEVADGAIGSTDIATGAVGSTQIANDSVAAIDVAPDAIGSSEIAADAVGASEIAADSVGPSELLESGAYTVNGLTSTGNIFAWGNSYFVNDSTSFGGLLLRRGGFDRWFIYNGADDLDFYSYGGGGYALNLDYATGAATMISLRNRSGNNSSGTSLAQLRLSYAGTDSYTHAIRSRHNSGADTGNAIDFALWDYGTNPVSADGTKLVMSLDGEGAQGKVIMYGEVQENGCADGTVEQRFPGLSDSSAHRVMVGCAGSAAFVDRATLCAPGWHVCSYVDWQNNFGAVTPTNDYWVQELLFYNGTTTNNCAVSASSGVSCGGNTSMLVCSSSGNCNWKHCGYGTTATGYHYYFGGCVPSGMAGALCCKGEPQAYTWQFADSASDNVTGTWLDGNWANVTVSQDWYLFVEVQRNATPPIQYCLANADWYVDSYLALTPGAAILTDPGLTKYYRTDPSLGWTSTTAPINNYFGAACNADSYSWCLAWGLGGVNLAVIPEDLDWGEVYLATSSPSTLRLRIGPSRYSACGF